MVIEQASHASRPFGITSGRLTGCDAPKPGGLRAIHTDRSTPNRMNSSSISRSLMADGRFPAVENSAVKVGVLPEGGGEQRRACQVRSSISDNNVDFCLAVLRHTSFSGRDLRQFYSIAYSFWSHILANWRRAGKASVPVHFPRTYVDLRHGSLCNLQFRRIRCREHACAFLEAPHSRNPRG